MSKRHKPDSFTPAEIDEIEQRSRLTKEAMSFGYNDGRAAAYRDARRGTSRAARYAPPKVIRGDHQPEVLVCVNGEAKIIPGRRGWGGDSAFVDWLNFTVADTTFLWDQGKSQTVPVDQLILEISYRCEQWFGFGISGERPSGANFYKRSWSLGDGVGLVCHGGQKDTVLISLSGSALAAAKPGWELRLFEFLEHMAVRPRITRCDVAYDDFDGSTYSVDQANTDFDAGFFNCRTTNKLNAPVCEMRGDWKNPRGKGRTFYVGSRKGGKFARIYEKGKQLGDKLSEWLRAEVEFKSVDRVIPHDILLKAGEYLAAAYPALNFIRKEQQRIKTVQKAAKISYQKMLDWLKHQAGAALWFASEIEGGAEALLQKIMREGVVPKRVDVPHHSTMTVPIHAFS